MKDNITNDPVTKRQGQGITRIIDGILWSLRESSTKAVAKVLTKRLYGTGSDFDIRFGEVYKHYQNMIRVRKSQLKKWSSTKVYGQPHRVLEATHRTEWELEGPLAADLILKVKMAGARFPRVEDEKPTRLWYTIPNRNRQLEYHDEWVSVRVMPQSRTVRILPARNLSHNEVENRVWDAFANARLSIKECDRVVRTLLISARHRVFGVGPVSPFKIPFYRESLGITLSADGSHPNHIEVSEDWPSWIKLQLEVLAAFTRQLRRHLSAIEGLDTSAKGLTQIVGELEAILDEKKGLKTDERELPIAYRISLANC